MKNFFLTSLVILMSLSVTGCISFNNTATTTGSQLGMFASPDRGETWFHNVSLLTPGATEGSIGGVNVISMALDPTDSNTIYIGTTQSGLFYSYDGTSGWQHATSLSEKSKAPVYSIAVDPKYKCNIYAGVGNKIFKSVDCNRNWIEIFKTPQTTEIIRSIVVDWYNQKNIYAVASDGSVYKSVNEGESWLKLGDASADVREMEMDPNDSRILYIVTSGVGLYKSVDSGVNWLDLNKDNLKDINKDTKTGYGVELVKSKPNEVYYLSKFGLLKSTNAGEAWEKINLLTGESEALFSSFALDPNDSKNIYMTDAKILYRSGDGGQTWETKPLPSTMTVTTLKVNRKDGNVLYMGLLAPEK